MCDFQLLLLALFFFIFFIALIKIGKGIPKDTENITLIKVHEYNMHVCIKVSDNFFFFLYKQIMKRVFFFFLYRILYCQLI